MLLGLGTGNGSYGTCLGKGKEVYVLSGMYVWGETRALDKV